MGRHPRFAQKILTFGDEGTIFQVIEDSIKVYKEKAETGERFGRLVERLGIGEFLREVL